MIKSKIFYVKPECQELALPSLNHVLMGSNEGYDVDSFEPFDE